MYLLKLFFKDTKKQKRDIYRYSGDRQVTKIVVLCINDYKSLGHVFQLVRLRAGGICFCSDMHTSSRRETRGAQTEL
jgi:hypothetical protein